MANILEIAAILELEDEGILVRCSEILGLPYDPQSGEIGTFSKLFQTEISDLLGFFQRVQQEAKQQGISLLDMVRAQCDEFKRKRSPEPPPQNRPFDIYGFVESRIGVSKENAAEGSIHEAAYKLTENYALPTSQAFAMLLQEAVVRQTLDFSQNGVKLSPEQQEQKKMQQVAIWGNVLNPFPTMGKMLGLTGAPSSQKTLTESSETSPKSSSTKSGSK